MKELFTKDWAGWSSQRVATAAGSCYHRYFQTLGRTLTMGKETSGRRWAFGRQTVLRGWQAGKYTLTSLPSHPPISYQSCQVQQEASGKTALMRPSIKVSPLKRRARGREWIHWKRGKYIQRSSWSLLTVYSLPGAALTTLSALILITPVCPNNKFQQSQ